MEKLGKTKIKKKGDFISLETSYGFMELKIYFGAQKEKLWKMIP